MAASGEAASVETEGATELNLGVKLRYAREAQALSLDDVAAELRISAAALKALEECRFDAVGPAVFAKGYLKQYAAVLGLDVQDILADYERAVGNQGFDIEPSRSIKLRDERQIVVWVVAAIMLVVLTALLLVWWFRQPGQFWGPPETEVSANLAAARAVASGTEPGPAQDSVAAASSRDGPPGEQPVTAVNPPQQQPVSELAPEPVADVADAGESAGSAAPSIDTLQAEPVATVDPEPISEPPAEPIPATDDAIAAASDLATAPPAREPTIDTGLGGPVVEVVFVEDSWAEITSADSGDRLFYRLGEAGTSQSFVADSGLRFFFGNARGVLLRLDGEPVAIPASARRGDLAQFDLSDLRD